MPDVDLLAKLRDRKPRERTVTVALTHDAEQALIRGRTAVTIAQAGVDAEPGDETLAGALTAQQARLAALYAQHADDIIEFRLRALSRREWAALCDAHPSTPAQRDEFKARARTLDRPELTLSYNLDTFPVALLAATIIEPRPMTVEEVTDLVWDRCSDGECALLFYVAQQICEATGEVDVPFGSRSTPTSKGKRR